MLARAHTPSGSGPSNASLPTGSKGGATDAPTCRAPSACSSCLRRTWTSSTGSIRPWLRGAASASPRPICSRSMPIVGCHRPTRHPVGSGRGAPPRSPSRRRSRTRSPIPPARGSTSLDRAGGGAGTALAVGALEPTPPESPGGAVGVVGAVVPDLALRSSPASPAPATVSSSAATCDCGASGGSPGASSASASVTGWFSDSAACLPSGFSSGIVHLSSLGRTGLVMARALLRARPPVAAAAAGRSRSAASPSTRP